MALTITYIPYIIAELPTNLLLRVSYLIASGPSCLTNLVASQSVGPNIMMPTMLTQRALNANIILLGAKVG